MNLTCNSTLEHMRISPGSEIILVGPLNFHDLARIISAACTLIAVVMSLYLIWMHALHYTKPREQRYIIRILFMVPVYAISSYLQIEWYWHAIYFQVIADCYEAFAIASFFALLCHYVAPDLHSQKSFFREMRPIKPWVLPVNWMAKCCGGQRGPWRTPKSGLTWFNINWIGIYHYCFIRVAMTISAVVSQYFDRYCESSNSPVFGHIWIIVINAIAVSIAMFCLIQVYVQLREALAEHKLLIKIIAIKLVVFLSFWQASAISVGTSTLHIVQPNKVLAYPDIKVGIPALLLCVEMAAFALLHLWAFPYSPYDEHAPVVYYPSPNMDKDGSAAIENEREPKSGGLVGFSAIFDALNAWDIVKAFGRGVRWLFCGVKRRKEDISYRLGNNDGVDLGDVSTNEMKTEGPSTYEPLRPSDAMLMQQRQQEEQQQYQQQLQNVHPALRDQIPNRSRADESVGLMDHAQPNPEAYSQRQPYAQRPQPSPAAYRVHSPYDDDSYAYSNTSLPRHGQQPQQQQRRQPQHLPYPRDDDDTIGQAMWEPPAHAR